MVAFGNQCKPFSIVTPTRANSEGKLQGKNCWSKISKHIFEKFSCQIRQFQATLFFSIFNQIFWPRPIQKSLFDIRKWSHSNCAILIGHSTHYQTSPHTCNKSKCLDTKGTTLLSILTKIRGGGWWEGTKIVYWDRARSHIWILPNINMVFQIHMIFS